MMSCARLFAAAAAGAIALAASAQPTASVISVVNSGLTRPVYAVSPPGDFSRIFVIEQRSSTTGRIRIVNLTGLNAGTLAPTPFLSISPVSTGSEQGLLGLAFHPDYATNGRFFVNYTDAAGDTVVAEYRVSAGNPNVAGPTPVQTILFADQPFENHNGGWLSFGPDGYLYIALGDGGGANDPNANGQNTNAILGKMLRIDVNGDDFPGDSNRNYRIPPTNPFVGRDGLDEIWALGLRNPWRNGFDKLTGDLWIADVGQDVFEEINRQPAGVGGRNYGWRCMEAFSCTGLSGCICNAVALTLPVTSYQHVSGRCSITGGYVYRGCAIPSLYGYYVYADYCTGEVWARNPDNGVVTLLLNPGSLITSFGQDSYGELYITRGSQLRKIVPVGTPFLDCNSNGRPDCWDIADGRSRDRNGNGVPDECDPPCPPDFNGDGFVDFFDFDDFVTCFDGTACPPGRTADFNNDGFVDFFDFDDFVLAFAAGC